MTPAQELFEAVKAGDAARAESIVDADPGVLKGGGAAGIAPLMLSIYYRKPDITALLVRKGADVDAFTAAAMGDTARLKPLVEANPALVHAHSSDGWTPLHLAAFFGHLEATGLLLARGSDVKARSANNEGNTAFHAASAGNHTEVCAALLSHGAEVNATYGSYTALHNAAAHGNEALVRLLLAHEADPNVKNKDKKTPLDLARDRGHARVIEILEPLTKNL